MNNPNLKIVYGIVIEQSCNKKYWVGEKVEVRIDKSIDFEILDYNNYELYKRLYFESREKAVDICAKYFWHIGRVEAFHILEHGE